MRPVLAYWDIRGLAECLRYLLAYAGVEYEDKRYGFGKGPNWTRVSWLKEKKNLNLEFPNLPYYLDGDVRLTQSLAILRHLGRKYRLLPTVNEEHLQRRIDILEMEAYDLILAIAVLCNLPDYDDDKRRQFVLEKDDKMCQFEAFLRNVPFVAGEKVTYVDFLVCETLDVMRLLRPSFFNRNYPALVEYLQRVLNLPGVHEYVTSSRFKPWPIFCPFARALGPQHTKPND